MILLKMPILGTLLPFLAPPPFLLPTGSRSSHLSFQNRTPEAKEEKRKRCNDLCLTYVDTSRKPKVTSELQHTVKDRSAPLRALPV